VEELIGILLAVAVVVWLIYLLVKYVIAPIAGVLMTVTMTISLGYAFIISIRSFVAALINHIDPYTTYVDKSSNAQPGTKRNYFFGPGYHQIAIIVKEAFASQKNYLGCTQSVERSSYRSSVVSGYVDLDFLCGCILFHVCFGLHLDGSVLYTPFDRLVCRDDRVLHILHVAMGCGQTTINVQVYFEPLLELQKNSDCACVRVRKMRYEA